MTVFVGISGAGWRGGNCKWLGRLRYERPVPPLESGFSSLLLYHPHHSSSRYGYNVMKQREWGIRCRPMCGAESLSR
jgi:hypothetical protein